MPGDKHLTQADFSSFFLLCFLFRPDAAGDKHAQAGCALQSRGGRCRAGVFCQRPFWISTGAILSIYICVYIICTYILDTNDVCVCVYIYIYTQREGERERETHTHTHANKKKALRGGVGRKLLALCGSRAGAYLYISISTCVCVCVY